MRNKDGADYGVGYRKPPKHSRFRKGRSGNPKGRPKGAKNLATALRSTLAERVVINENGHRKTISKLEGICKQLVNKAVTGDPKALHLLLGAVHLIEGQPDESPTSAVSLAEEDKKVMQQLIKRVHQTVKGAQGA